MLYNLSMSEGYGRGDHFTLDEEMMDSIRMEADSISPEKRESFKELSRNIVEYTLQEYGSHISDSSREKVYSILDRIIIVDEERYDDFVNAWTPKLRERFNHSLGQCISIGDMIVLSDRSRDAENLSKGVLKMHPELNEDTVNALSTAMLLVEPIVHEIFHACQESRSTNDQADNNLAFWARVALDECGAEYVTHQILDARFSNVPYIYTPHGKEREEFFTRLEEKYNDKIYDILFGNMSVGEEYKQLESDVLSEFTPQDISTLGLLPEELAELL